TIKRRSGNMSVTVYARRLRFDRDERDLYDSAAFCVPERICILRLSKRTEYGLRAVVQLARLWPRHFVQSRDLAQLEKLPNKFLESILLALRRGGFLESKVGSGGGYRLSRAPRDIVVGDVIRRLEGRLSAYKNAPLGAD